LQILGDFVEPRPRHRGADHIDIEGAQACLVVNRDALDANLIDPHRRAGWRRRRSLGGRRGWRHDFRLCGRQDARHRRGDERRHRGGGARCLSVRLTSRRTEEPQNRQQRSG
jgi:hypothetical protein